MFIVCVCINNGCYDVPVVHCCYFYCSITIYFTSRFSLYHVLIAPHTQNTKLSFLIRLPGSCEPLAERLFVHSLAFILSLCPLLSCHVNGVCWRMCGILVMSLMCVINAVQHRSYRYTTILYESDVEVDWYIFSTTLHFEIL